MTQDKNDVKVSEIFNHLKEMAISTNAGTTSIKSDDGEWEYSIVVRRKQKKNNK